MSIADQMASINAASALTGSMLGAQNASSQWMSSERRISGEAGQVGVFKIIKVEDGFIVRCAKDEGYIAKTYVAHDIDEAFDKAKAHLVSEALK